MVAIKALLCSVLIIACCVPDVESSRWSLRSIFGKKWNLFGRPRITNSRRCTVTNWTKDCPRDTLQQTRTLADCTVEKRECKREDEKDASRNEGKLVAKVFMASFAQEHATTGGGGSSGGAGRSISVTGNKRGAAIASGDSISARGFSNIKQNCEETKSDDSRTLFGNCGATPKLATPPSNRARRSTYSFGSSPTNIFETFRPRHVGAAQRDILFLLDESGSIGSARFEKVKEIAAAIVKLLCDPITVEKEKTRVALVSFDEKQHEHFNFNRYLYGNANQVADRIMNVRFQSRTAGKTCLSKALDYSLTHIFTPSNGARLYSASVRQDIILISDGCENCDSTQDLRDTISRFMNDNYNVYVIGVNLKENCKDKLKILAGGGSCYHFFFLDDWDYRVDDFIRELEFPPNDFCLPEWQFPESCDTHTH